MIEKISFPSAGQGVEGTIICPSEMAGKKPGVIFFHGMTSSEKGYIPIAERLADSGIVGMTLSIRGHGESEGDFNELTVTDAIEDGLNAYDFFAKYTFLDTTRIGLCGTSVGAAISSIVSEQRVVKSLVLRVPATYTDGMMGMTYAEIMSHEGDIFSKVSNIADTSAVRAIKNFDGSVLIITSEKDIVIPVNIPAEFFSRAEKAKRKERIEILGATHNLTNPVWRQQFIDETVKWFVETL